MARKSEALLEEESIIRNRFLTQTTVATSTGGGPPFRRLANRYKDFFSNVTSAEDRRKAAEELLADLYSLQAHLNKLNATASAYLREQQVYHQKHQYLLDSIDKATEEIGGCKTELEKARLELAQEKECERIKEKIVRIPARSVTTMEIEAVKQEIEELENQRSLLRLATEKRKHQFRAILHAISQVEQLIAVERKLDGSKSFDLSTKEHDDMAID